MSAVGELTDSEADVWRAACAGGVEAEFWEMQALRKDAERYRWLRDRNDWYAEPRIDEEDGTKWELVFYTPQRIEDPTDDDNLDAAVDAAIAGDSAQK